MGVNFWHLKTHAIHTAVSGKEMDLIQLSHANIEQIINPFLFPNSSNEAFQHGYVSQNAWVPDFFDIYYSAIHESFLDDENFNMDGRWLYPVAWKLENMEFFSFHDCLLHCLLSKFLNAKSSVLADIGWIGEVIGELRLISVSTSGIPHNSRDKSRREEIGRSISKIISDKKILSFANKLLDNLIEYKKCNFSNISREKPKNDERVEANVKKLFLLLRENREILLPYVAGYGLEKYFPSNLNFPEEDQSARFDELLRHIFRFKKTNKFIQEYIIDNALRNHRIQKFAAKNRVFYEVIGLGDESLFNQKTKLIFPIFSSFVDSELNKKSQELLKPKFQKLTIFNHNTKAEEIIFEPTTIWLDVRGLLKGLSERFISDKNDLKKIKNCENLQDLTEAISESVANKNKKSGELKEGFRAYLKKELTENPNPLAKNSKNGNSYKKIARNEYGLGEGTFNGIWKKVTDDLPKNSHKKKAGRPKNDIKKS